VWRQTPASTDTALPSSTSASTISGKALSPDEIVSAYPSLTLSDVYAALAYYHDHRADIDADIKADDEHWAEIERQNPGWLIDRLRQRKANAPGGLVP
jgi:hypothetical protein